MKRTSTASLIAAIVLVAASIALFVLGALNINATQIYSRIGNGYNVMRISYNFSLARTANGFLMVLLGGFLFLGGIMLFILAAMTHPAKANGAVPSCTLQTTQEAAPTQTDASEPCASCADCTEEDPVSKEPSTETETQIEP